MRRIALKWLLCVLITSACGRDSAGLGDIAQDTQVYWPTQGWRVSTPARQHMDATRLAEATRRAREQGEIDGMIVIRNGYIVLEEYFNGWTAERAHTLQSVSKSVTSLLIGAAVGQNRLTVDQPVLGFFPEYTDLRNLDERKRALRVQDLLTMRTGLDWSEANYQSSPLRQLNESRDDWVRFVLDWPMATTPGTRFEYNSGGVIVLSGVLRAVSGAATYVFAREALFNPLGVSGAFWYVSAFDSLAHTGGGLNMKARDLARIGLLVMKEGRWEDRQLVPAQWIRESTQPLVTGVSLGNRAAKYGYLWWLLPAARSSDPDIITGSGSLGQWLFIDRAHQLIVVFNGNAPGFSGYIAGMDLLYSHILPAVR